MLIENQIVRQKSLTQQHWNFPSVLKLTLLGKNTLGKTYTVHSQISICLLDFSVWSGQFLDSIFVTFSFFVVKSLLCVTHVHLLVEISWMQLGSLLAVWNLHWLQQLPLMGMQHWLWIDQNDNILLNMLI